MMTESRGVKELEEMFASNSNRPLEVFVPSIESIRFWDKMFPKCDEVSVVDYFETVLPIFEKDCSRKFNSNQIMNLIDYIDFEGRHLINKYESYFFIDRVWNDFDTQKKIWNEKHKSMKEVTELFLEARTKLRDNNQKSSGGNFFSVSDIFKPYSLKDYLPPHKHETVPHDRDVEYSIECTSGSSKAGTFTERYDRGELESPEVSKGLKVDMCKDMILIDKRHLIKPVTKSKYAEYWLNYTRVIFGEERGCDLRFPEADVNMGSYHFTIEKFDNILYIQDISRYSRVKFRVMEKPYVLDEGMVGSCYARS